MNESKRTRETYELHPIGYVHQGDDGFSLEILEPYRPALKQLEHFSHVMVFWWADQHDNDVSRSMLQCRPPYAEEHVTGVFATRAEYRPNPVAMTTCPGPRRGRGEWHRATSPTWMPSMARRSST